MRTISSVVVLGVVSVSIASAQQPDPALLSAIRAIRAIDNHSHPPALSARGQKDDEFDALPCDPLEPTNPALTTIEQPIAEIAQTAVDTLRTLIEDPKPLPNSYFRPNLRIRSSTGPAPR